MLFLYLFPPLKPQFPLPFWDFCTYLVFLHLKAHKPFITVSSLHICTKLYTALSSTLLNVLGTCVLFDYFMLIHLISSLRLILEQFLLSFWLGYHRALHLTLARLLTSHLSFFVRFVYLLPTLKAPFTPSFSQFCS